MSPEVQVIPGRDNWEFAVFDPNNPTAAVDYVRKRTHAPTSLWLEVGGVHNNLEIGTLAGIPGIAQVQAVHVMGPGWKDLAVVQELRHLRKLNIGFEKSRFDFKGFSGLLEVSGVWSSLWSNLDRCPGLRSLQVSEFNSSLEQLPNPAELRTLSFIQSRFPSLRGLEQCTRLHSLEVANCSKLGDISAIASLAATLTSLEIDTCRRIASFDSISNLEKLESLKITDCPPMSSLDFIHSLSRLHTLNIYGTPLIDHNLGPVLRHPTLRVFRAQRRRAFTPTLETVQEALSARQSDA